MPLEANKGKPTVYIASDKYHIYKYNYEGFENHGEEKCNQLGGIYSGIELYCELHKRNLSSSRLHLCMNQLSSRLH